MTPQPASLETPLTEKNTPLSQPTPSVESSVNTPEKTEVKTSVKLTGRMLNFTRLHIQGDDLELIKVQLDKKLGQARQPTQSPQPKLPVLVSCNAELDLATLWNLLWQSGLQPIGIVTGRLDEQALAQKIPIFPADGERLATVNTPKPPVVTTGTSNASQALAEDLTASSDGKPQNFTIGTTSDAPATAVIQGDRVYTQIVRSGQSINHVGGDLILTNSINAGAEAITDYSLHVYSKAEGRLVAGATGDSNARIFCLRFNPSLVSVAGTYCLRENIPTEFLDKAVQVSYEAEKGLVFQLMTP